MKPHMNIAPLQCKSMSSKSRRSGNALVVVVILLGLAVAIYLFSPRLRTKVNMAADDLKSWKPDHIQKDPVGYLTWSMAECDRIGASLEARQLAMVAQEQTLRRGVKETQAIAETCVALLAETKVAFLGAQRSGQWPIQIQGARLDELASKRKLLELDTRIRQQREFIRQGEALLLTLESKIKIAAQRRTEAAAVQGALGRSLEIAQANQVVQDLDTLKSSLAGIQSYSEAISLPSAEAPTSTLVERAHSGRVDEQRLAEILKK